MSQTTIWNRKVFFYPIGNTPAVDLARSTLAEETKNLRVLLLGCGDPRSVLYTLYAGRRFRDKSSSIDFTCCDLEPAIIARNIFLYTLLMENHAANQLWNAFYHFKVDDACLSLITSHATQLVQSSTSLDTWNASAYSEYIHFATAYTLQQVSELWSRYARGASYSGAQLQEFSKGIRQRSAMTEGRTLGSCRSAGPFAAKSARVLSEGFDQYWRSGCVDRGKGESRFNPLFLYSAGGEGVHFHYGMYPLEGFHLAEAFSAKETPSAQDFADCARAQFGRWCDSFREAVSARSVALRFVVGDAISLCHTLRSSQRPGVAPPSQPTSLWDPTPMLLDSKEYVSCGAPTRFDVIDTSNLVNLIGSLNIMVCTIPLLSCTPSTTLYTESLVSLGGMSSSEDTFLSRLLTDLPTFCSIFGIAPTSYLSAFSSASTAHHTMLAEVAGSSPSHHQAVEWKIPAAFGLSPQDSFPSPSFQAEELAVCISQMYVRMFPHESMERMMAQRSSGSLQSWGILHYHRGTLVALLAFLKTRVVVEWDRFIGVLLYQMDNDQDFIFHSNYNQELFCQLHLQGVHTTAVLRSGQRFYHDDQFHRAFPGWTQVPQVLYLVLTIPRKKIRVLEEADEKKLGSPPLLISVKGVASHNMYASFQSTFGHVRSHGSGEETTVTIEPEEGEKRGWLGDSDLIVWFPIPALTFTDEPAKATVNFELFPPPETARFTQNLLGLMKIVFSASVTDRKYVQIVKARPSTPQETILVTALDDLLPTAPSSHVTCTLGREGRLSELQYHVDVGDPAQHEVLSSGVEVKKELVGPWIVKIDFGNVTRYAAFPIPIDDEKTRVQIARKTGYIKIIARPLGSVLPYPSHPLKLTPVIRGPTPFAWAHPRLDLDAALPLRPSSTVSMIAGMLSGQAFSPHERALREQAIRAWSSQGGSVQDAVTNVKDSVHDLFLHAVGSPPIYLFGLHDTESDKDFCFIFVNAVRLDVGIHAYVADTCVLPLTTKNKEEVMNKLIPLGRQHMRIKTSPSETLAWRYLMPKFVERCKTWSHKPTCEYTKLGGSFSLHPHSTDIPLCSCGSGVDIPPVFSSRACDSLVPYVSRAAISQLYLPTFLGISPCSSTVDHDRIDSTATSASVARAPVLATCQKCGKTSSSLRKCSVCNIVSYCSRPCQKADWKVHKKMCTRG